jgi:putative PIN family toxin of toxin-antitoxin system
MSGTDRSGGPPRIVFDTNVVVSALLFRLGRLAELRELWRNGAAAPLVSRTTTEELLRVLAYPKFKLSESGRGELLADFLPFAEIVAIPDPPPKTPLCRDPNDVQFLELAIAGKADALVTGDADLHALKGRVKIAIVTPDQWLSGRQAP